MLFQKPEQTKEYSTLDIKVQRSGMILVRILSFRHLNILRKRQIKHYCMLLVHIEYL